MNKGTFARYLRRNQTDAELALWLRLRNRQLLGVKFRRQVPIGSYIVDFISFEKKVIIEIDGGQHNEDYKRIKDEERTLWFNKQGYDVLRFWNTEIVQDVESVLTVIMQYCKMYKSEKRI